MGIDWTEDEHRAVAQGVEDHGIETKRCAALARIVYRVAKPRDPSTRGIQIKAPPGARWLVPRKPHIPYWHSHTFIETMEHDVDAITGPDGYAARKYLEDHWHWPQTFNVQEVDVATVDPGIEDVAGTSREALRDAIIGWVDQRMANMLATPRMWGSDEAIEMQALLLLELRALALQPERELANPGRVFDTYATYLGKSFPLKPHSPLFEIVQPDELGMALAGELRKFLDAFVPTMLEENPFQHNDLAIRLSFQQGRPPTTSAFTGYYEGFRRAARAVARRPGSTTGRAIKSVEVATDFELADVRITPQNGAPAEVMLLLGTGVGRHDPSADEQVREALSNMVTLGEWAGSSDKVSELPVDNVEHRMRLAVQTLRILPRGDVAAVGIGGRLVGRARPVVFRAEHERRLVDVIGESTVPQPFERRDEIRAIDLDRGHIILGKETRTRCYVRPEQLPEVVAVGAAARVTGKLFRPLVGRPFVLVDTLEVGRPSDDEA